MKSDKPQKWLRPIWTGVASIALIALALTLTRIFGHESLEHSATTIATAIDRTDAKTLFGYVHDNEKAEFHLTPEKLQSFMDGYVKPSFAGYAKSQAPHGMAFPQQGVYELDQIYSRPDGRRMTIAVTSEMTESGPKTPLITELVTTCLFARYGDGRHLAAPEKMKLLADGISRDKDTLNSFGISGFVANRPGGQLVKWDDYVAHLNDNIRKLAVKPRSTPFQF